MTEHFFTTTAGVIIPIQPISLLDLQLAKNAIKEQFKEEGKPIDPPTYEIFLEFENKNVYEPHTEATIQEGTEEEKEAWQKHFEAAEEMSREILDRTALITSEGIIFDLPEDDSWIKRRKKLLNEDVPEDEDEKRLYYINNVLLKTQADRENLTLEIHLLSMTGASSEAIEAYEEWFRGEVAITNRKVVERLKAQLEKQKELVLQSTTKGRTGSEGTGDDDSSTPSTANRGSGGNHSGGEYPVEDGGVRQIPRPTRKRQAKAKTKKT